MPSSRCPKCRLLHGAERRCFYDVLLEALGNVRDDLTPEEDRHLRWLAGFDHSTVGAFVGIFRRLRGAGAVEEAPPGPGAICSRCLRRQDRHGPDGRDVLCPDGFVPRDERTIL